MKSLFVSRRIIKQLLKDRRLNAIVLGPGLGVGEATKAQVAVALKAGRACVLDADALTSFADAPGKLFDEIENPPARRC